MINSVGKLTQTPRKLFSAWLVPNCFQHV